MSRSCWFGADSIDTIMQTHGQCFAQIDPAYDGKVFNVVVADIPARRTDVVAGEYILSLQIAASTQMAVKITDMLGEEMLLVLER